MSTLYKHNIQSGAQMARPSGKTGQTGGMERALGLTVGRKHDAMWCAIYRSNVMMQSLCGKRFKRLNIALIFVFLSICDWNPLLHPFLAESHTSSWGIICTKKKNCHTKGSSCQLSHPCTLMAHHCHSLSRH